jgi:proline iminopeptidase
LKKHVSDIDHIRQHLKAKKVYLFGHSFGGILAQRYASLHPEKVSALLLMGSGPPTASAIGAAQIRLGGRIQQLTNEGIISGPRPTEPARLLEYMLPAYFSDPKFPIPEEIKESSFNMAVSLKNYSDSGMWDFREELKKITCPVLFLWGEDDPFGTEMADVTKDALVNAKLVVVILKKCGHYWQENMKDFLMHVEKFLKSGGEFKTDEQGV